MQFTGTRPVAPYVVVDQNLLRDEEVITALFEACDNAGTLVLLTDAALMEMMKGDKWEYATRRSLEHLSKRPELVVVGAGTGELMRREQSSGHPHVDIVDHEVTSRVRSLLQEMANGSGPTLDLLKTTVPDAAAYAEKHQLNHVRNKEMVLKVMGAWAEELSEEEQKTLRRKDSAPEEYDRLFRSVLADRGTTKACAIALSGAGYEEAVANWLALVPSVSSHHFLVVAALALKWLGRGGLDGMKQEKVTNEVVDLDYVLAGSFSIALLSNETGVREMDAHIRGVVDARWSVLQSIASKIVNSAE